MKRRILVVLAMVTMGFMGANTAHAGDYWACIAVYDIGACLSNPLPPPPDL